MRPVLSRARAAVATLAAALLLLGMPAAHAAPPDAPPKLTDGFGLTQVGTANGTATDFVITVKTSQVAGEHRIRILLPADYAERPDKRYPVFYLLHGAADSPADPALAFSALTASSKMITVIPDGGLRGWYANWLDQHTAAGAQNWETFHIEQVIPFIDANLRTVAAKKGRAVGGISMGGFGSLHYAQAHPELFSQVAAFSGAVDLSMDEAVIRAAVVATLTNIGAPFCGSVAGPGQRCALDFGPAVSSDAVFGSPYPVFNADRRWNQVDPSTHMDRLRGMGIALYTGDGAGRATEPEFWARSASQHVKDRLDALGMPYHYVDYGNGAGWGDHCDGGHNGGCWDQDLTDYVPRLEAAFTSV
ncbi:alpha/beta hydrolase [Streptomyces inhibens]|uniref:alpha/beta hydrolase n=1 Tax=Streptomyces inhibens TaxID=2293571 RepID=UPI001EE69FCF|nr:alpha/beta hydrolase-fold protein [Streptomyces inhibens]UKY54220.1 esterase [Streptomyces inhibens]